MYGAKRKFNSAKVIIDGEEYNILLDFFDMYSEKVKKQIRTESLYDSLSNYITTYSQLETKYKNLNIDNDFLQKDYINLKQMYDNLKLFIFKIFQELKDFFRDILLSQDENRKEKIVNILEKCYKNDIYSSSEIESITKDTDTEIVDNDLNESLEKDYDIFE